MPQGIHIESECSEFPRCAVQMPESNYEMRNKQQEISKKKRTLIASVRMAAITSSEPSKTRLSSRDGSYSQMAVAFSMMAIFVICFMTAIFLRLTTWPKQLKVAKINWNKIVRQEIKYTQ